MTSQSKNEITFSELVSRHYFDDVINIDYNKRLPISLLLSLHNVEVLENFKAVLLSLKFRENLEKQIEMYGDYSTMMWFQDHDIIMSESALIAVAKRGDLGLFRAIINDYEGSRSSFRQDCVEILTDSYIKAAENGHLNILEYAISTDLLRLTDNQLFTLMDKVSFLGHLEILKWFYPRINRNGAGRKFELDRKIFFSSILGNKMHILEWIYELLEWDETQQQAAKDRENNFGKESMLVAKASRHGNLSMVKFLIDKGFEYMHTVVTQAASASGNLEVLMYLRSLDCPWSETIYLAAAEHGHLEILKWAESHGCPWDNSDLFPAAAKSSNRDVYQWLLDRQCPFKEEVSFHVACECGNFEFMKFSRANRFNVQSDDLLNLIDCAADRGDLETIYWALDQMTLLYNETKMRIQNIIVAAATHCHMHILEWIGRFGGIQDIIHWAINPAVIQGHVDVLKWVVRNGYQWDAKKDYQHYLTAITYSNLQVLVWMNSCAPIFTTDMSFPSIYASQLGKLEIVKWLHKNGCPCNQDSIRVARENRQWRTEKWIYQQLYVERRSTRNNSLDIWM